MAWQLLFLSCYNGGIVGQVSGGCTKDFFLIFYCMFSWEGECVIVSWVYGVMESRVYWPGGVGECMM